MINVSILSKRELVAHDNFVILAGQLGKLSTESLNKVFHRLQMLHVVNDEEELVFRRWVERVNKPQGVEDETV